MTTDIDLLCERAARQAAMAESGLLPLPDEGTLRSAIEHVVLRPDLTEKKVGSLCERAVQYGFAALCLPMAWVACARRLLAATAVQVNTTAGFPGGGPRQALDAEVQYALDAGAHEIQIFLPTLAAPSKKRDPLRTALEQVRMRMTEISFALLVETPFLSHSEIVAAARLAEVVKADRIKGGSCLWQPTALQEAALLHCSVPDRMKISCSVTGGPSSAKGARSLLSLGVDRISTDTPEELLRLSPALS